MTKYDCHRVGCKAAGHVCQCAQMKECPLHEEVRGGHKSKNVGVDSNS